MQLSLPADGTIQFKGKIEHVVLGATVSLNGYAVPGRGEFDIAGVQCEVTAAGTSLVYSIRFEDLQITYLSEITAEVAQLDDVTNCNILAVDVRSSDTPDVLKGLIKAMEPSYVVLCGAGATETFRTALSLPQEAITNFKVTRVGLPLEGTTLLHA